MTSEASLESQKLNAVNSLVSEDNPNNDFSKNDLVDNSKIKNSEDVNKVHSLDFILDIPLKLTAELGRSRMTIRDILQLSQGSVIELAKFAGEPLEILVNDKLIARGEVVVVNEKFGIRLTDIISPTERIEQLK